MRLTTHLLCVFVLATALGCSKTRTGQCPPPNDDRQWFFITDNSPLGTERKCVYCDDSIPPEGTPAWIRANAGPDYQNLSDAELANRLPCVYVYGPGPHDTEDSCSALACSNEPEVNDPVRSEHQAGEVIRRVWSRAEPSPPAFDGEADESADTIEMSGAELEETLEFETVPTDRPIEEVEDDLHR